MSKRKHEKCPEFDANLRQIIVPSAPEPLAAVDFTGSVGTSPEDVRIAEDKDGNICISDLFVMAGRPKNRRPNDWHRGARAQALENALRQKITGDSRKHEKKQDVSLYYTAGKGGGSKTFTHPVLALDYAEFVDPKLGIVVRDTFLRYKANDVTLAVEIMTALSEQAEYDELRVELRALVKKHNRESAGVAQEAGVQDFAAYNGAGLRGLYGGLNKAQVLKNKGLASDDHHLEFAGHEELAANYFKATQAIAKLKRDKIKGQGAAEHSHEIVGLAVRNTIKELGGTMPEDEPALEHVREAEKRLKAAERERVKALPKVPPEQS